MRIGSQKNPKAMFTQAILSADFRVGQLWLTVSADFSEVFTRTKPRRPTFQNSAHVEQNGKKTKEKKNENQKSVQASEWCRHFQLLWKHPALSLAKIEFVT